MTDKARLLIDQARALSPEERIEIAEALMASLKGARDGEVEAAWDEEIQSRIAALERGEVELHDAGDVLAEARRRLGNQ